MERIAELSQQFIDGKIGATEWRSRMVAQFGMLDDDQAFRMAKILREHARRVKIRRVL